MALSLLCAPGTKSISDRDKKNFLTIAQIQEENLTIAQIQNFILAILIVINKYILTHQST